MTFSLACGDVMPGCEARFSTGSRDALMSEVAQHAAEVHGITGDPPRWPGPSRAASPPPEPPA